MKWPALLLCLLPTLASGSVVTDFGANGGDETDDSVAIQAALDAVPASGGSVYVPPGTYLISAPLLPKDRTTFYGSDSGTTTIRGTNIFASLIDISGRSNIKLTGLTLTFEADVYDTNGAAVAVRAFGETDHTPSSNVSIKNCIFRDTPKQAIVARGLNRTNGPVRWTLTDNEFYRIGRGGAVFFNGDQVTVTRNTFAETGDDAIAFNHQTTNSLARGNHISMAGSLLGQGAGIKVHGQGNTVKDNKVFGAVNGGIFLKASNVATDPPPSDNYIYNNQILGLIDSQNTSTQAGIQLADVAGLTVVAGNTVTASSPTANYDVIRIEAASAGTILINNNKLKSALAGKPGKAGLLITSPFTRVELVNNEITTLGDTVLLNNTARKGWLAVIENRFLGAHTNRVLKLSSNSAGIDRIDVLGNVSRNHTGEFFHFGQRPVDLFRVAGNDYGSSPKIFNALGGVQTIDQSAAIAGPVSGSVTAGTSTTTIATTQPADYFVSGKATEAGGGVGTHVWFLPSLRLSTGFTATVSLVPPAGTSTAITATVWR